MITPAQIRADFNKLRDPAHEHGQISILRFNGHECRAIRSTSNKTLEVHDYGEKVGFMFTVRFLVDDLPSLPAEKDIISLDGTEFQVAEVHLSAFGQIVRVYCLDEDA
jgi:hypothetical protein